MTIDELEALCDATPNPTEALPKQNIVLYGAGNKGREVLHVLRSNGHTVDAFIDRRTLGEIDGVPVIAPDDPRVKRLALDGHTAIVSVFNFSIDPLEVHALLNTVGFRRVVGAVELRQHFQIGETYWLGSSAEMVPPAAIAKSLWQRFKDSESLSTLEDAIALRRTFDPRYLRRLSAFDQYAPSTVPTPRTALRFVDGGAYDGDTMLGLRKSGCEFEAVAAFEPDPQNYVRLARHARQGSFGRELLLFPCGLGSHTEQVRFRSQGLSSSAIAQDGESFIQVVAIDDCAPMFRPTYVKLDIEGAERSALKGMERTIRESRPALAICVYHKPSDLWEIPSILDESLPDATFYLRAHAWNGFELVLYAIPNEMIE
jgi:FkbM family methyltransferase